MDGMSEGGECKPDGDVDSPEVFFPRDQDKGSERTHTRQDKVKRENQTTMQLTCRYDSMMISLML